MKNFILTINILFFTLCSSTLYGQDTKYPNRASWWESELEYRELAGVELKKGADGYFKRDYQSDTKWLESYPGILRVEKIKWPHNTELHFYSRNKELFKVLSLEKLNPFWTMVDSPISRGSYDFEYHDIASEELLKKNVQPTEFLTLFYGAYTNKRNGITIAHYGLTALHTNLLMYMKTAILIIDPNGEVIHTLIEDDSASGILTSDNGSLIAYDYGGYLNNPVSASKDNVCRVYDFEKAEITLIVTPQKGQKIKAITTDKFDDSLVHISYVDRSNDNTNPYMLDLIDLNKRERYIRFFEYTEFMSIWKTHQSYKRIIEHELEAFKTEIF